MERDVELAVHETYRTRAQYYTLKLNRLNQLAMRLEKAASTLEKSLKEARGLLLRLHGHTAYERAAQKSENKVLRGRLLKLWAEICYSRTLQKRENKELRGRLLDLWGEVAYNRMLLKRQAGGEA